MSIINLEWFILLNYNEAYFNSDNNMKSRSNFCKYWMQERDNSWTYNTEKIRCPYLQQRVQSNVSIPNELSCPYHLGTRYYSPIAESINPNEDEGSPEEETIFGMPINGQEKIRAVSMEDIID